MKRVLLALSIAAAVLLGLFLPVGIFALQDLDALREEEAGVQQVDLSMESGLTLTQKLGMLSADGSSLLNIGVGRTQTPETLSALSWSLLSGVLEGAPLLEASTAVQQEQSAVLVTNGDSAFVFWRVLFCDDAGNRVTLFFDDETGMALGMSCSGDDLRYAPTDSYAYGAFWWIVDNAGLEVEDIKDGVAEQSASGGETEKNGGVESATYPSGTIEIVLEEDGTRYTIPIRVGNGWFDINAALTG